MLPFGVNIPATVPQSYNIPEERMNYLVYSVHSQLCLAERLTNDMLLNKACVTRVSKRSDSL